MANEKLKAAIPAIVREMNDRSQAGCQCPEPRRLFPTGFCRDCGLLVITHIANGEGLAKS